MALEQQSLNLPELALCSIKNARAYIPSICGFTDVEGNIFAITCYKYYGYYNMQPKIENRK